MNHDAITINFPRTWVRWTTLALGSLTLVGCQKNPLVEPPNARPIAVAWVEGEPFPANAAMRAPVVRTFDGEPVRVTLDATRSSDEDGRIVTYRWLSATLQADGSGRLVPGFNDEDAGQEDDETTADTGLGYPADVEKPVVTLPVGEWRFALWVIDDQGEVSDRDSVVIRVGATGPEPEVLACVEGIELGMLTSECEMCICSIDEACRTSVTACGADCWMLVTCTRDNCPDYAAMSEVMDFSCVMENCGAFLGAVAQARPAGACLRQCPDECAAE